jgi:hypothetical protein
MFSTFYSLRSSRPNIASEHGFRLSCCGS